MASGSAGRFVQEAVFWIKSFLYLPYFWYIRGPIFFFRSFYRFLIYLDQGFAVTVMLRLFFVPLFGDYSLIGYCLAFIFRVVRIVVGIAVIVLGQASLAVLFWVWLVLPFNLLRQYPELGVWAIGVAWIFAFNLEEIAPLHSPEIREFFTLQQLVDQL